jgi:hypothetical protein
MLKLQIHIRTRDPASCARCAAMPQNERKRPKGSSGICSNLRGPAKQSAEFDWRFSGAFLAPWRGCDAYRRLATAHVVNESHIVRPDGFLPLSRVKNAPKMLARFMLAAKK